MGKDFELSFELTSQYTDQDGDIVRLLTNKDDQEIKIVGFAHQQVNIYKKDIAKFKKALQILEDMF